MSLRIRCPLRPALGVALALALAACDNDVTPPDSEPVPDAVADASAGTVTYWLTLLHNNDGESELLEESHGAPDFGGVARFASLVRALREDADRRRPSCEEASGGISAVARSWSPPATTSWRGRSSTPA
jgi:hypothetical protein